MNDDQIRSELERRAGSAASALDWTKRALLPAVWREVDARPQPVVTARWSTGVGVAALVVALLVVAVAVPRLAPAPPGPSPTGEAPIVLTAAQLAERAAADALRGKTVLVQARLVWPGPSPAADPACLPPDGICGLGIVEGTKPEVYVVGHYMATTDSPGSGSWTGLDDPRSWHFPSLPIEGVLALRGIAFGEVELLGVVREGSSGPTWSVRDAAALDISTFTPDDVAIVRGRLYSPVPPGTVYDISCPGGRPFDGLPSRSCGNFDSLSTATPGGDRIEVQAGAANEFDNEREALYAISPRLYGSCAGTPPCWLWDVVARIAEEAELTSSPMPTDPTPSPIAGGTQIHSCRWDADDSSITVIDHSGLIVDCWARLRTALPGPGPLVFSDEPGQLLVEWKVNADCPTDERIEVWGPIEDRPQLADYMLRVARTTTGGTCDDPNASRLVYLALSEPVDDQDVQAFLTIDGRGVGTGRDWGGMPVFRLEIAPSKPEYTEGEAVEVTSSLWPETDVTVTCLFSYGISVEQLDGGISFYPGPVTSRCPGPRVLRTDEPVTADFVPVWGLSEPNPLAPWLRDGELYLPPGTYLFTIRWTFGFPDDAPESYPEGPVELEASVVVTVR